MTEASQFLVNHGALILFAVVFLEQIGIPLPALPFLLAAGALSATGKFNAALGIVITVLAAGLANMFWFYLGRYQGTKVLGFLCRISLEPDSCVRRTQNLFTRHGMRGVVVSKFVPGLNTLIPPLAGMAGVHAGRFIVYDGLGSLLFGGCFIGLGFLFNNQVDQIESAITHIGGTALSLIVILVVLYIVYKFWRRQTLLRELRMARMTVVELRQKQTGGENPLIVDLRSSVELKHDPSMIPGAIRLSLDDVENRHQEIPRDREVVVYCSCPNEVSSARMALLLHRKGIKRVRPLLGGIDAWKELNYPVETFQQESNLNLTTL